MLAAAITVIHVSASAQTISYYQTGEEFAGPFSKLEKRQGFRREGDGLSDDAAAIGAAIKALKDTTTNAWSVLYFPAGTYLIGQRSTTPTGETKKIQAYELSVRTQRPR